MTAALRLGVDIGGTKCLGVAVGEAPTPVTTTRRPTPVRFPDLVEAVVSIVGELEAELDGRDVASTVGIGLPGLVDRDGRLHAAPHLEDPIELEPIEASAIIAERLGRRVLIDNDATCATVAEWRLGAARGLSNFVLVTLGTGIGGGVVSENVVLRGEHGFAGELGHIQVDRDGAPCSCGKHGCWETVASGRALGELSSDAARRGTLDTVVEMAGGDVDAVGGELVEEAARCGDPGAQQVLDVFARQIAVGLATLTNVFDPAAFVLGGGLAGTADVLAGPLGRWLDESLYSSTRRPRPSLRFAELGAAAGAMGAALLSVVRA